MSEPLYTSEILRLTTEIPHQKRLDAPQASTERRSPTCGSRIAVDVIMDDAGRVLAMGQDVRACALGQASASLMGAHAIGRSVAELETARDDLAAFLAGARDDPGDWPGLHVLARARDYPARHPSIRLPFEAVAEAARNALG